MTKIGKKNDYIAFNSSDGSSHYEEGSSSESINSFVSHDEIRSQLLGNNEKPGSTNDFSQTPVATIVENPEYREFRIPEPPTRPTGPEENVNPPRSNEETSNAPSPTNTVSTVGVCGFVPIPEPEDQQQSTDSISARAVLEKAIALHGRRYIQKRGIQKVSTMSAIGSAVALVVGDPFFRTVGTFGLPASLLTRCVSQYEKRNAREGLLKGMGSRKVPKWGVLGRHMKKENVPNSLKKLDNSISGLIGKQKAQGQAPNVTLALLEQDGLDVDALLTMAREEE